MIKIQFEGPFGVSIALWRAEILGTHTEMKLE